MRPLLLAAAAASLVACSTLDLFVPTSNAMHEQSPAALATRSDRALVVFLRPSYFGAAYALRVVDENGCFVADVAAHTHVAAALPPGEHVFTMAGRELDIMLVPQNILYARLGAARVYFVLVDVDLNGPTLSAVTARTEDWARVREWIADTPGLEPNDDALGKPVLGGSALMEEATRRAAALTTDERAMRTLNEEDGVARAW
jgi:hypothetical protein